MTGFSEGTRVKWNWSSGTAEGEIEKVYTRRITRTLKGTEVTREASEDSPAYLIVQSNGNKALKSHSEIDKL